MRSIKRRRGRCRDVDLRIALKKALRGVHAVVLDRCEGDATEVKAQEAIDRLAKDLGEIYRVDLSDLED